MSTSPLRVAIVGGGIGGAAATASAPHGLSNLHAATQLARYRAPRPSPENERGQKFRASPCEQPRLLGRGR